MPMSAQEWFDSTRARIGSDGYRPAPWAAWPTWPFSGELVQRDLQPSGPEQPRRGVEGDCFICREQEDPDSTYLVWGDDLAMVGAPDEPGSLLFAAFLMPRGCR